MGESKGGYQLILRVNSNQDIFYLIHGSQTDKIGPH